MTGQTTDGASPMRVIFAGTPQFAVQPLSALLTEHEIAAVYTQPDRRAGRGKKLTQSPVKQLALAQNIPVFQPTSLADQAPTIESLGAEVMVVVAYGMLLPQEILDIPALGCINIHASILPRWRGAAPIQRAIEAGDTETGVSIMKMEIGLDTGPVYHQLKTPITDQDTSSSLHDRLSELGAHGILTTLNELRTRNYHPSTQAPVPVPQDNSQASYAKKIRKQEAQLDWSLSARQIQARIRAFNPWPICQTEHYSSIDEHTRIRLWQSSVVHLDSPSQPAGTIVDIGVEGVIVACGKGYVQLEVLQRDGSRPLSSREFCNGYPLKVGEQFAGL